jgi:ubiquinone/menaquinone biosynthesis C-methylase UbiE
MRWLWPTLTAAIVADGLHLRGRVEKLTVLEAAEAPVAPGHRFITAVGVVIDDATARAASAHAAREGLDVLDLVPADLPAELLLDLLRTLDPAAYRDNVLVKGYGALTAILVSDDVVARAGVDAFENLTPREMAATTARLKTYAPRSTDLALAPELRAGALPAGTRVTVLDANVGKTMTVTGLAVDAALFVTAARTRRPWAVAAAVARASQPFVATSGTAAQPRDMPGRMALRFVSSLVELPRALAGERRDIDAEVEAKREEYDKLLAGGLDRFFEDRRPDCPVCGSADLHVRQRLVDRIQCKPGEFVLEECAGCGHIFQNPRLSLEGLDFYYRDFYDGLAEEAAEGVFVNTGPLYRARAEMVRPYRTPTRWLDVGGGHGHFCLAAKDVWPDATFDVLDISETIEEAERMGWVGRAHRGWFTEQAADLAGRYDVVSMSHYLEHTRDQGAEIDAVRTVLPDGGLYLVEVPDPESVDARILGQYWFPWFQPQHQHFLSVDNLRRLLADRGFETLEVERAEVHIPVDFSAAAGLYMNKLHPRIKVPWRPRPTAADRARRAAALAVGSSLVFAGGVVDVALRPLGGRLGTSNAYRLLARKVG